METYLWVRMYVCVCVCVCVRERKTEGESKMKGYFPICSTSHFPMLCAPYKSPPLPPRPPPLPAQADR